MYKIEIKQLTLYFTAKFNEKQLLPKEAGREETQSKLND